MGCIMTKVIQRRQKQALKLSLPPLLSSNLIMSESDHYFSLQTPPNNQEDMTEVSSDFEKLGVLGHGSSASIYKVRNRKNGSVYALKVLRREGGGSMMNPVHEAEILSNLYSEFLVRCHGLIHDEGKLCLVMEYMEYGSLHGVLKTRGWMPEAVISMVARRVLNGLRYLHGMKIVHRDIKPSNLLINGKGEIKIADFGVSTKVMMERPNPCETTQGTWAYMSPERFDPEKWGGGGDGSGGGGGGGGGDGSGGGGGGCGSGGSRGFAGDVWSLGLVLFECFVGQYPLIGPGRKPDWASLSCAICFGGPVELPEGVSPEFLSFLRKCLEKDWRKRGTVSELLRHPFVNASGCDPNKDVLRYLLKH